MHIIAFFHETERSNEIFVDGFVTKTHDNGADDEVDQDSRKEDPTARSQPGNDIKTNRVPSK